MTKNINPFYNIIISPRIIIFFIFILFLCSIKAHNVYAHKVYIFAWAEGDTIYTESYSGDKRVSNGVIKVFTASGDFLLEGKTDTDGNFSFKIPQQTDLKIVLEAGMGHRAEYLFRSDDIREPVKEEATPETQDGLDTIKKHSTGVSTEELRKVMEEVLDDRLNPISKRLARIEDKKNNSLTDIIGGIGYILGIMGIVIYFRNRATPKQ